ncbi:EboA domain-containing protein [Agromyces seonyuensis]|uniref:EboA domain-containing protein n=1 Tax=Agromyces seonyuensis TaxID=2662446 RepID=UPI001920E3FA|nr:EboA domain-containing protein [Agromyces seonyuensis]
MTTAWTASGEAAVRTDPARIAELFPEAGRAVGRTPLDADDPLGLVRGTLDDEARARLVGALLDSAPAAEAARTLADLYRYGDDAERRGVLHGLNAADPASPEVVEAGLAFVADALRANDPRLVAAALGAFAAHRLDQHAWRHGVLKALFMGIPLDAVADLERRTDPELARMAAGLVAERRAAGRTVSDDVARLAAANPAATNTAQED